MLGTLHIPSRVRRVKTTIAGSSPGLQGGGRGGVSSSLSTLTAPTCYSGKSLFHAGIPLLQIFWQSGMTALSVLQDVPPGVAFPRRDSVCGGVPSGVGVGGFHRCSREQQAELHYLWETPLSLSLPVRLQLFIRTDFPQKRRLSLRWVCSSRREKSEASVNQKKWFFTSVAFVASQSLCCYVLTSLLISVFVWGGGHCQTQEEEEEEEEECIK